jgi:hypothetical protein
MRPILVLAVLLTGHQDAERIGPPPADLNLSRFYQKYVDAGGIPIVSSGNVSDAALLESKSIILQMISKRPDVVRAMSERKIRVAIMARTEVTTDVPEHSDLNEVFPGTDWNKCCRGVGATSARPASSGAEENVLQQDGDRYKGESILIHEFSHSMLTMGIDPVEPKFRDELRSAYTHALANGRFENTYAASNVDEYWAEGVQDWFDANLTSKPANGIHNEIGTRAGLKTYDPTLAALLARVFGDEPWRWSPPNRKR